MMFYNNLIEIQSIIIELDKMDLSKEEKVHLATLLDSSLHHTILDAIFSELTDEDKKVFALHLQEGKHREKKKKKKKSSRGFKVRVAQRSKGGQTTWLI